MATDYFQLTEFTQKHLSLLSSESEPSIFLGDLLYMYQVFSSAFLLKMATFLWGKKKESRAYKI